MIPTIVSSLAWGSHCVFVPVGFLLEPSDLLVRLCLIVELSGICSAALVTTVALVHEQVAGYQLHEVYAGTPEECADSKDRKVYCKSNSFSFVISMTPLHVSNRFDLVCKVYRNLAPNCVPKLPMVALMRKVYHGRSEGKRWSVHMTQIKL